MRTVWILALCLAGCAPLKFGKNESKMYRKRGVFAGAEAGGGISTFTCDGNCKSEAGDIGMAAEVGLVASPARAFVLGGRWLARPTTAEYSQGEVLLSYRRWLIPFLWVSGGAGLAWQRSTVALVDTDGGTFRTGGAAVGSAAYELIISPNVTFDIRLDTGIGIIPDGSYWFGVAGIGVSFYASPVYVK